MKKKNVINLIKYYSEKNDLGFRDEAYEIAKYFDDIGDNQLAEYIFALLSNSNTFVPQGEDFDSEFFEKVEVSTSPLPLPKLIQDDVLGMLNAINKNLGVNKFLFQGAPGTGKTETVKHIARILERELFSVNFSEVIDSKLGQTQKNITKLFKEMNNLPHPDQLVVMFDEIDAIALDRTNSNDLREMGRATSTMLKGLDTLNERVVVIATTNLFSHIDKALIRRFDSVIDFNRYSRLDIEEISEIILEDFLSRVRNKSRNSRLFRKIIGQMHDDLSPGEMKNIIRTAVVFSNPNDDFDYLRRFYMAINEKGIEDTKHLRDEGFTVREIEVLTGVSKSQVSRDLRGIDDE